MTTTAKRTDQLRAGDRVRLHNGLVRTVASVNPTSYLNYQDKPILAVSYLEGRTAEWSAANTAIGSTVWNLADDGLWLNGRRIANPAHDTAAYVAAWSMVALTNGSAR